jgi:hypothetical protein
MAFEILASDNFEVGKNSTNNIVMGTIQLHKNKQDRTFMSSRATYVIKDDVTEVVEIDEEAYRSGWGTAGWGTLGFALAGPVGAGLVGFFKGKTDSVVCGVKFRDGKSALIKIKRKHYRKLSANTKLADYKATFSA